MPDGAPELDQRIEQRRELMAHALASTSPDSADAAPGHAAESGVLLARLQGGAALLHKPREVAIETSLDGVALARWGVAEIAAAPSSASEALPRGGVAALEVLGGALRASTIAAGAAVAEVTYSLSLLAVRALNTADARSTISISAPAVSMVAVRTDRDEGPCLPSLSRAVAARHLLNVSRAAEGEPPAELAVSVRYSSAARGCARRLQAQQNEQHYGERLLATLFAHDVHAAPQLTTSSTDTDDSTAGGLGQLLVESPSAALGTASATLRTAQLASGVASVRVVDWNGTEVLQPRGAVDVGLSLTDGIANSVAPPMGGANCSRDDECYGGVCCSRSGACECDSGFSGPRCEFQLACVIWNPVAAQWTPNDCACAVDGADGVSAGWTPSAPAGGEPSWVRCSCSRPGDVAVTRLHWLPSSNLYIKGDALRRVGDGLTSGLGWALLSAFLGPYAALALWAAVVDARCIYVADPPDWMRSPTTWSFRWRFSFHLKMTSALRIFYTVPGHTPRTRLQLLTVLYNQLLLIAAAVFAWSCATRSN